MHLDSKTSDPQSLDINKYITKILECTSSIVISGIEKEIESLNADKAILELEVQRGDKLPVNLHETIEKVMDFLSRPPDYWLNGDLTSTHYRTHFIKSAFD